MKLKCMHWLLQYGVKIFILTSFRDTCYIEILPVVEKSRRGNVCFLIWLLSSLYTGILDSTKFYWLHVKLRCLPSHQNLSIVCLSKVFFLFLGIFLHGCFCWWAEVSMFWLSKLLESCRAVICLSFWAEVHYTSIYPEGGIRCQHLVCWPCLLTVWFHHYYLLLQSCWFWRTKRKAGGPSS